MTNGDLRSSDEELVILAQRHYGSPEGLAVASELFGRWQERVYLWCLRRVGDHDHAMDLAQDVQLNAYRALPRFEARARFSSWLFAIARNRCKRALRRPSLVRDDERDVEALATREPDPGRAALERLEEERVLELMKAHLLPHERDALWLRCYHRMSVEEVTQLLGFQNPSGARAVLQSARRKLRAALGTGFGEEGAS